ncbi:hypothetical protein A2U01_0032847, partial [Trifolium medium]|nr:hypothetical protein [Trifolium medium]
PLAERLKQRTKAETAKAFQKQLSKGKSSEPIINSSSEAQVDPALGFTKPLTTILPENETVFISSSTSPDTAELDKVTDELIQLGNSKMEDASNSKSIAQQFFNQNQTPDLRFLQKHLSPDTLNSKPQNQTPDLRFLEKHLSPDTLNSKPLTHEQPQQQKPDIEQVVKTSPQQENQE